MSNKDPGCTGYCKGETRCCLNSSPHSLHICADETCICHKQASYPRPRPAPGNTKEQTLIYTVPLEVSALATANGMSEAALIEYIARVAVSAPRVFELRSPDGQEEEEHDNPDN